MQMKPLYLLLISTLIIAALFLANINPDLAEAKGRMSTRNGAVDIEFNITHDVIVCVTTPCPNDELELKFFNPTTGKLLEHVNYCFNIITADNQKPPTCNLHTHDGIGVRGVEVPDVGSFTLEIHIEGLGIDKPYDTKYSGFAIVAITGGVSDIKLQKTTVTFEDESFDVYTSLSNGSVIGIDVDRDFTSLIISLDTSMNKEGELIMTLPRALIDSKVNGEDDEFIILLDGEEVYYEENKTAETERELTILIFAASEEVEIIGTRAVPEFPIAMIIVGTVFASMIILVKLGTILKIRVT